MQSWNPPEPASGQNHEHDDRLAVAHALLRTQSCEKDGRSQERERGTQECMRHVRASSFPLVASRMLPNRDRKEACYILLP
jgi:hypothetical protein